MTTTDDDDGLGFLADPPAFRHPELDVPPGYATAEPPPLEDGPPEPDDVDPLEFVRYDNISDEPAPEPEILIREDGRGLFYRAAVNSIAGDPGIGKTFAALLAVVATLGAGGRALLIDYEDTPARLRTRLVALGATPTMLERVWGLIDPGSFEPAHVAQTIDLVRDEAIDVVIIDSATPSIEAHDLDENAGGDYSRWHRYLPQPLARVAGACVIIIDHRTKPPETRVTRNLWAVGSRHKLAALDGVAYVLESRQPFSRTDIGRTGVLDLVIAKDRHGGVGAKGDIVARIELTPQTEAALEHRIGVPPAKPDVDPTTGERSSTLDRLLGRRDEVLAMLWTLWEEAAATDPGVVGLTTARVRDYLRTMRATELEGPPLRFRDTDLRAALWAWRDRGQIAHTPGPRGADLWRPIEATVLNLRPELPLDGDDLPDPDDPNLNF